MKLKQLLKCVTKEQDLFIRSINEKNLCPLSYSGTKVIIKNVIGANELLNANVLFVGTNDKNGKTLLIGIEY